MDEDHIIRTAHALADAAREVVLPLFRAENLTAENKVDSGGFDPVTQADRDAEAVMRAHLAESRPDDGILGEEFSDTPGTSGLTWVIDPIDGTRSFLTGLPTWGVLIAVSDATGPLYGLIDQPYIGERFEGGFGAAKMTGPHGDRPLKTRKDRPLADAVLSSTYPEIGTATEQAAFQAVASQVRMTRYGMDCYAYALMAAGQIDLVIEAGLNPYDIQAPIAVIQAAGGIVTNWSGGPAHEGGQVLAAASAAQHDAALSILSRYF